MNEKMGSSRCTLRRPLFLDRHDPSRYSLLQDILGCEVYTCEEECDKSVAEYARKRGAIGG